jgi:carboxyl-terminal processing protease
MRIILVAIASIFLFAATSRAQSTPRDKAIILKRMIELNHYSPRAMDDSFSASVFRKMMNMADSRRLLFTASDYKALSALVLTLDDELQGKSWAFLDLFTQLYQKALSRGDSIIQKSLQKPFDFSVNETISSSRARDNFLFATDRVALENRWSRYLKFMILGRVYEASNADSAKKAEFKTALTTLEPGIREKIKQAELKTLKKITDHPGGFNTYVTDLYFNAIATSFDPHTNYFSPREKEVFQSNLSSEGFSFGLDLEENDNGEIYIERLAPGGPAWKSGELHKGDELLSLQWEGKEAVEVAGLTLEDVLEILDQSSRDRLVWKFRKTDGTVATVFMRKEKIDNEENVVKSFVLKGEKKIGYILLPGFYTEWGSETGSSCANDVAKEIVKLKKENIDGLILDVRFNGGGSISEAIDMIGIFIDAGPLAADKDRKGDQNTFKDPNRGTIYDGPLALMVNGQSASASEMLAAALQDYNRAVIAGSNTYGKATMQQMFALDTFSKRPATGLGNTDMVKITIRKLYRLSGMSAQLNGVKPDVVLPDAFDGLEFREKFQPNALSSDTAKKNNYYTPLKALPMSQLAEKSAARISANEDFAAIKKIVEIQQRDNQTVTRTVPLKWDGFEKWIKEQEKELELIEGKGEPAKSFTVENHAQDKQLFQNNAYAKEVNETWLENLSGDIYLQEVYLIVTDLINLQKLTPKK